MKNWRIEVFNFWDHRDDNALCESMNRLIKNIQRAGSSYDFDTVREKAICTDVLKHEGLRSA
jgi:hypothetical protein